MKFLFPAALASAQIRLGERSIATSAQPRLCSLVLLLTRAWVFEQFQRLMADNGVDCSMRRSGNVWDNAAMESFFSSLETERIGRKVYRTRDAARADVFDYIERFYNTIRRHSTNGYLSPAELERKVRLA